WRVLGDVDPLAVEAAINRMARQPTERLAWFIDLFRREQFLRCYSDDGRLLTRLNQVLSRVRLSPLPPKSASMLAVAREIIRQRVDDLLPPEHFSMPR
ncbi:MAG: hypothetical protein H7062_21245, partial [Candidatus Saccharimonas sp.]|nr:hypothetical protein [Planctomycetaceae bacterium]